MVHINQQQQFLVRTSQCCLMYGEGKLAAGYAFAVGTMAATCLHFFAAKCCVCAVEKMNFFVQFSPLILDHRNLFGDHLKDWALCDPGSHLLTEMESQMVTNFGFQKTVGLLFSLFPFYLHANMEAKLEAWTIYSLKGLCWLLFKADKLSPTKLFLRRRFLRKFWSAQ